MINLTNSVACLFVLVFVLEIDKTEAVGEKDANEDAEEPIELSDHCFYKRDYNFTDEVPRVCINHEPLSDDRYIEKKINGSLVNYDIHNYYFGAAMTIVSCVHKPQSIVKLTYFEKRGKNNSKIFESIDKGQVLAHIKLDKRRSTSVICETNDDELNKHYVMNISFIILDGFLPYFVVNDMELHLMKRKIKNPITKILSDKIVAAFEYFANPGELQTIKIINPQEPYAKIKSCKVSSGYESTSTDFAKEHYGEFIFNSSETKKIECYIARDKLTLYSKPYSPMPSSLSSDFIYLSGLHWYNVMNTYVRRDSKQHYNFTYTYNYSEKDLKLTCVSQTVQIWQYDDKAIMVKDEVKPRTKNSSFYTDLTFTLNDNYNETVVHCVSVSGHRASVVLQRSGNYPLDHEDDLKKPSDSKNNIYNNDKLQNNSTKDIIIENEVNKDSAVKQTETEGKREEISSSHDQDGKNSTYHITKSEAKLSLLNCPQSNNNTDMGRKLELANKAFGAFIGYELDNVPISKRRLVMYQIIKLIDNNS